MSRFVAHPLRPRTSSSKVPKDFQTLEITARRSRFSEQLGRLAQAIVTFPSALVDRAIYRDYHGLDYIYDDDEYEDFIAVLERLKVSRIGRHVQAIRAKTRPKQEKIPVVEVAEPSPGVFHVSYQVKFADGVTWLLQIPAEGTPDQFNDEEAEGLRSEAVTMIMLRRETTIPIPKVFAFDNTCANELKVPYILMEFIDANSLLDVWHDRERKRKAEERLVVETGKGTGSYTDPKKAYTNFLDRWEEQDYPTDSGMKKLLQMFINWLPSNPSDGRPFVLAHTNSAITNFLVAEDGSLRAILDWRGAQIFPRNIGSESYTGWLTHDWAPIYYWNEEMEQGIKDENVEWEDSPVTLDFYRRFYARCFADLLPGSEGATITRQSLVYGNLILAANNPRIASGYIKQILRNAEEHFQEKEPQNTLPAPLNPSGQKQDVNGSKEHINSEGENATGTVESPNAENDDSDDGSDDKSDGSEPDIQADARFDHDTIATALDNNNLSKKHEDLLKAAFLDLIDSL
ncbi:Aminoglycoside phosphotransferase [Penicillium paradoxum]|uniref:Aminoglycoside phosphotransferase n=1 Tax=Penicillium paradoxum TaxID=176176 RepID=UPI002547766A|nr:Aminoglycoside phosphotransferase [Penicillium paradoxum]KAJ5779979.1 Aminoglycoside phosphotransferase [Penicillium paradoxum]